MNKLSVVLVIIVLPCILGQYKSSKKAKKVISSELGTKLHYMTKNVRDLIKQYGKKHSMYKAFNFPRVDLSARCSGKTRSGYTPARIRAVEIMKILQEFIGEMQQLQMDESQLPKGSLSITKNIRHLEYELRDFTESSFRQMVRKGLGRVAVPYSLGTLPNKAKRWMNARGTRRMHLLSLYQLLHCLTDVRRASTGLWQIFSRKNIAKYGPSKF